MSETTVNLELTTKQGNWHVYNLSTWGATVERVDGKNKTTVWASFSTPEGHVTSIAQPDFPGAGPQPEGTETNVYVQDLLRKLIHDLEQVIKEKQENKEAW